MEYFTVGQKFNAGKVAKIKCFENSNLENIDVKNNCFLLVILTSGKLEFSLSEKRITAMAPAFICFDEQENPKLLGKIKARYCAIYFHPEFLNVNMTFDFIRSKNYKDMALTHDMFMLKPFIDEFYTVPIIDTMIETIKRSAKMLLEELRQQSDWYWSCRSRSYFMEIIITLERMYECVDFGKKDAEKPKFGFLKSGKLRDAILFIEGHYMEDITLKDITTASGINHTTLTDLIKKETGMTPLKYLYFYRVQVAKKQLEFTDIPVKDVAFRTGFKRVSHFTRCFKEIIGTSPAEFRKLAVAKRRQEIF